MSTPEVDTTNRFLVTCSDGRVLMLNPLGVRPGDMTPFENVRGQTMTPKQACELAAWLVCMAEVTGRGEFEGETYFVAALNAIRNP